MSAHGQLGLFDEPAATSVIELVPGAVVLRGFALAPAPELVEEVERIAARAPFRHMLTPGGAPMSAAMTSCGPLGWVSDARGYRYSPVDPERGIPWPEMPPAFRELARGAAERAGFRAFEPDACLINRYAPGARMGLHQDKDERDLEAPIVSVSLGLPAVFLFGGATRAERPQRVDLVHGDVVVFGGTARLRFHGVLPIAAGHHPLLGARRVNLTFRRAG